MINGDTKYVKPTLDEMRAWQEEVLEGLAIVGGPSTPAWKRFRPDPESFFIPFSVIIDPRDMQIKHLGGRPDTAILEQLLNQ